MTSPQVVHETLCNLAKQRARADHELGRWLLAADRLGVHQALGYAGFGEYAERLFGFTRRQARERLRVAAALESLPAMSDSLQVGDIAWSIARELTRVASDETERAWLGAASGRTAREVERMVVQHQPGDLPTDPPTSEPPRRIVLEVSAPTWALFEEARKAATVELGGAPDDDALVTTLARALLAGASARDDGRASYAIAMTVCERCEIATQSAGPDEVVVDEGTLARARCDARNLGRVDLGEPARATQDVPPKVRRAVLRRHNGRCAVPGCRHAAFLDVHHTERRADGGDHDPDRLIVLCGAHHAGVHSGTLVVRGIYSEGFAFEHADGVPYGATGAASEAATTEATCIATDAPADTANVAQTGPTESAPGPVASPVRALSFATSLEILVGLGFKQSQAQRMLDRARTHVGHEPTVDEVVRAALAQAPISGGTSVARESVATYERIAA